MVFMIVLVLVEQQTYRLMGQDTEHRNRPKQIQSTDFWQRNKAIQWRNNSFFNKWCWNNWTAHAKKKKKSRHCPYTFHKNKLKMDHRTKCKTQNSKTPGSSLASSILACELQLFTVSLQPVLLSALALCPIAPSSWGHLLWPAHLCWQQIHGQKQGTWHDRCQTEHQNVAGQGSLVSVTAMG